jgi:hypothetical protein
MVRRFDLDRDKPIKTQCDFSIVIVTLNAGKSISNSAKKTGKSIKKAFSDIRLKENITLVGVVSGLNIYEYNYIWSNEKQTGVMAQELLSTKYKNAVSTHKSGYFMVDYSELPL